MTLLFPLQRTGWNIKWVEIKDLTKATVLLTNDEVDMTVADSGVQTQPERSLPLKLAVLPQRTLHDCLIDKVERS